MSEDEWLAWLLLYSGGVGLIGVYWLVVALAWFWGKIVGRESRYDSMKRRVQW